MTQKQSVIEHKDWLDAAAAALWPHNLVEQIKNAFKISVPEGYQDEKGFHFGTRPANGQK